MMQIQEVTAEDDLEKLANAINQAKWDEANEMTDFDSESLLTYLQRQDTILVTCFEVGDQPTLLGFASSRIEIKPYDKEEWLYIDEVDVCADQRRKGVGTKLMNYLIALAKERGCDEVWLGTELDNVEANALYQSLQPQDVLKFVGYTFKTKRDECSN